MSKYADLFMPETKNDNAVRNGDSENLDLPAQFNLLFVDDEENVLNALKRIFLDENYRIFTTTSPSEALVLMGREKIHLIISDHRMPGMTGAELLKEIKQKWPETIRIMLTGHADIQSIMGAVNEGAVYKFITKPWNDEDLRLTVSIALQQYVLLRENAKLKEIAKKQSEKIKNYATLFDADRGIIGTILLKANLLNQDQFNAAVKDRRDPEGVVETIARLGFCSEDKIIRAVQDYQKVSYLDLKEMSLSAGVVKFLPRDLCEKNLFLPIRLDSRQITIAMADPTDIIKCDNISFMTGLKVAAVMAKGADIRAQIKRIYGDSQTGGEQASFDDVAELDPLDEIDIVIEDEEEKVNLNELINSSGVPPIIRIVNSIISEAVRYGASDIHIEPKTKCTVVRYRIDGMLQGKIKTPPELHTAIISRIKILAKQDIAERRKPQDGRITVKLGTRVVDLRVSSIPTINGEKVVMRILDKNSSVKKLNELGILDENLRRINVVIKKPQGMVIATGPTGSGKTTLLYSVLGEMLQTTKNFETIEDPVEYFLEDANQVFVREKIGVSFASILRATMRQDPDVILVGEIRDFETADVAFKAALTGHMVLSTLHTNNAVASVTRLINMDVKPYIIASALECIIAQRLLRKICKHCRTEVPANETGIADALKMLHVEQQFAASPLYRGKGCERCNNTGFQGRTGIYELFIMTEEARHLISTGYKESELSNLARLSGMKTLLEDGVDKVKQGTTSIDELLRVLGPQILHERRCESCGKTSDSHFTFCPFCGSMKKHICKECRMPYEENWSHCPHCGTMRA